MKKQKLGLWEILKKKIIKKTSIPIKPEIPRHQQELLEQQSIRGFRNLDPVGFFDGLKTSKLLAFHSYGFVCVLERERERE